MNDLYIYADEAVDHLEAALTKMKRVMELAREPRGPLTAGEKAEALKLSSEASSNAEDAATAIEAVNSHHALDRRP